MAAQARAGQSFHMPTDPSPSCMKTSKGVDFFSGLIQRYSMLRSRPRALMRAWPVWVSGRIDVVMRGFPSGAGENAVFFLLLFLRSEEHTSELQSLMRIAYAVF